MTEHNGPKTFNEDFLAAEEDPSLKDPTLMIENLDMTMGAKLTFTFLEGLVV